MILYRYILRHHVAPFLFSNITLMFIFLLQFMMKFADRLIGKGLDTFIIIKLIAYNLAWMVVLVVPMACLVSALMAFGTMSQNNEVTIMRSSGISLYRMMLAPFLASLLVGYGLVVFNNDVLPDANHQAKILMQDISRQKPTLSLEPGVFSQEVNNYAILVRDIDKKTNKIFGVTIYDYTNPNKINIVTAKRGNIYFAGDKTKLIMDLEEGEIHETDAAQANNYRKLVFTRHRIAMNADQFSFQSSGNVTQRSERELSAAKMQIIVDSLNKEVNQNVQTLYSESGKYMYSGKKSNFGSAPFKLSNIELIKSRAIDKIRTAKNVILSNFQRIEFSKEETNSYKVEVHKKYSIPAACIIFILIGAPLGVMVRKGGFGVAASISLFFFLIYWAFLIGGEKLADRNIITPFWGMWGANVVLGIIGVFITFRSSQESLTLDFSFFKKLVPKWLQDINSGGNGDSEE
ncbi:MAG: LptF/LptG family permease [Bacteroidota bacterium]|nr:LptF/LptG family permease [Bacteroidota bacterium]